MKKVIIKGKPVYLDPEKFTKDHAKKLGITESDFDSHILKMLKPKPKSSKSK